MKYHLFIRKIVLWHVQQLSTANKIKGSQNASIPNTKGKILKLLVLAVTKNGHLGQTLLPKIVT